VELAVDFEPASVARPFTSKRFFTAKGTAGERPAAGACCVARARRSSTAVKALIAPSRALIAASARLRLPFRPQFVPGSELDLEHRRASCAMRCKLASRAQAFRVELEPGLARRLDHVFSSISIAGF